MKVVKCYRPTLKEKKKKHLKSSKKTLMGCKLCQKTYAEFHFCFLGSMCQRALSYLKQTKKQKVTERNEILSHNLPFPKNFPEMWNIKRFMKVRYEDWA